MMHTRQNEELHTICYGDSVSYDAYIQVTEQNICTYAYPESRHVERQIMVLKILRSRDPTEVTKNTGTVPLVHTRPSGIPLQIPPCIYRNRGCMYVILGCTGTSVPGT